MSPAPITTDSGLSEWLCRNSISANFFTDPHLGRGYAYAIGGGGRVLSYPVKLQRRRERHRDRPEHDLSGAAEAPPGGQGVGVLRRDRSSAIGENLRHRKVPSARDVRA